MKVIIEGFLDKQGWVIKVNDNDKEILKDSIKYPNKYECLQIRVVGYIINFLNLDNLQKTRIINLK